MRSLPPFFAVLGEEGGHLVADGFSLYILDAHVEGGADWQGELDALLMIEPDESCARCSP